MSIPPADVCGTMDQSTLHSAASAVSCQHHTIQPHKVHHPPPQDTAPLEHTNTETETLLVFAKMIRKGRKYSSSSSVVMNSVATSTMGTVKSTKKKRTKKAASLKAGSADRLPGPVCGKSVTARYLPAHQRQHSGERPVSCPLCPRSFPKSSDLNIHRRRHAGDRPHRCPASSVHGNWHFTSTDTAAPPVSLHCGRALQQSGLQQHQRVVW